MGEREEKVAMADGPLSQDQAPPHGMPPLGPYSEPQILVRLNSQVSVRLKGSNVWSVLADGFSF